MWRLDTPCGIWMSTTLYINITAQNLLSWKIVGDAECQGGGWADFEACHQRTTQAFPCQVHLAASLKTNTECCLDWEPHRAWQVPFSHVCLLWISAGQVQQWPSPVFWVSVQPGDQNLVSSSVKPRELPQQQYRMFQTHLTETICQLQQEPQNLCLMLRF